MRIIRSSKSQAKEKDKNLLNVPKNRNRSKAPEPQDSDEEQGFSQWIRSEEGLENLKLFVLGNTLIVFLTIFWPHIKEMLDTGYYMYIEYTQHQ